MRILVTGGSGLVGRYVVEGAYKASVPFNVYRKQAKPQ